MSKTLIKMYKNCASDESSVMKVLNVVIDLHNKEETQSSSKVTKAQEKASHNNNNALIEKLYNVLSDRIQTK